MRKGEGEISKSKKRFDRPLPAIKAIEAATTPVRFRNTTHKSNTTIITTSSTAVAAEIGPVVPFAISEDLWKFRRTVIAGKKISILSGRYDRSASSLLSPEILIKHKSAR
ncbi:MAG: hypothetical protein A2X05_02385 [Bacteroidetes bacterium GWE2_41_25]|nr:MAG: hypothetical protein A2X03_10355 [Bacteroidetes bacterium GWA2_40_15]OFX95791.1 MAG: hypothetical protein A2X06_09405 [Bacteroidetes bacterium GWC2_40_22]OFY12575.1 MAG: hypothetical protein A2X05_02385 [Bacteroidetes bacterium GWE2_41_25]OFY57503.1 MAG: hypothetical protein A2X04_07245 [Bacteroidetes bacterium GWF2_41_9]HAM09656.1 hypothetical protein [Bacteroidales bacterium]